MKIIANSLKQIKNTPSLELNSATICHGTMGVAIIFKKLYLNFWKDHELKEASNYWFNESFNILDSPVGLSYVDNNSQLIKLSGVLYGVEGVGLGILFALKDSNTWDSSILLFNL